MKSDRGAKISRVCISEECSCVSGQAAVVDGRIGIGRARHEASGIRGTAQPSVRRRIRVIRGRAFGDNRIENPCSPRSIVDAAGCGSDAIVDRAVDDGRVYGCGRGFVRVNRNSANRFRVCEVAQGGRARNHRVFEASFLDEDGGAVTRPWIVICNVAIFNAAVRDEAGISHDGKAGSAGIITSAFRLSGDAVRNRTFIHQEGCSSGRVVVEFCILDGDVLHAGIGRSEDKAAAEIAVVAQAGNDDCGNYEVSGELLDELYSICETILNKFCNVKNDKDKLELIDYINDKLPPQSGFFFGSTELKDDVELDYYRESLYDTMKFIRIAKKYIEKFGADIYYQSSW